MMTQRTNALQQRDFFTIESRMPAGFAYRQNLMPVAEEQVLLKRFEELPFKTP
jgi:hypothetical protein